MSWHLFSFVGMADPNKPIYGNILASNRSYAWKKLLNKNIYPSTVEKYKRHLKRW
jgi:hypothetical protein